MKFRKKPIVIEAFQMSRAACLNEDHAWPDWAQRAVELPKEQVGSITLLTWDAVSCVVAEIMTLEGRMAVSKYDWIIKGVMGELYPCKPDIFAATYEQVE